MKPWLSDAQRLDSLEGDICFLLHDSFHYGPDSFPEIAERKSVEPLPSLNLRLHERSMARSSELTGNEIQLVRYYEELVRLAKKHQKSFHQIRHYFWIRLWIWNTQHKVYIHFPWYDSFSEIDRFLCAVMEEKRGEVFFDADQGWEFEVFSEGDDFFILSRDPDDDETHFNVRFHRRLLLSLIPPIRDRTGMIIRHLATTLGDDVWTDRVSTAKFLSDDHSEITKARPWWKKW